MSRSAWVSSLLLSFACAGRPAELDEGAVTTDPSGSEVSSTQMNTEDGTTSTTSSTSTTTDSGDGDGDGDGDACVPPIKLDIPPNPDQPVPDSCTIGLVDWAELPNYPGCTLCEDWSGGCFHHLFLACTSPAPGQTCAELCPSGNCVGFNWSVCTGELSGWVEPTDWCGHYEIDGQCCTLGKFITGCAE